MIDTFSTYDNMHKNGIFYALICINNHVIIGINCTLSKPLLKFMNLNKFFQTLIHLIMKEIIPALCVGF